jgi:hypothetical protein
MTPYSLVDNVNVFRKMLEEGCSLLHIPEDNNLGPITSSNPGTIISVANI